MTNQSTIEKMKELKLHGMAEAFRNTLSAKMNAKLTVDELIGHLVDAEWDDRYNKKLSRLLVSARFRYQASMEEIDYIAPRNLDKNKLLRYSSCDWIKKHENIVITGSTGVGKSFIASALGNQACVNGFSVLYHNSIKLFSGLKSARGDGSYSLEMRRIQKSDVLILDDFGLETLDVQSRLMLLEIMEDRTNSKSAIITSQVPVSSWFDVIGDATIADAVCDRIIHSAHKIELKGESMRKLKQSKNSSDRNLDETCHQT